MRKIIVMMVALFLFSNAVAKESSGFTSWDDGILKWRSDDGNFELRMDTRIYLNGAYFFDDYDNVLSNQTNLRKARFALKTKVWKNWLIEFDIDVAEEVVEKKDMFVSYIGFSNSHIKFGNFKQALGLEELTSSRFITFTERAYPMIAFEGDRQMALEYSKWGKIGLTNINFRSSVFGQTLDIAAEEEYEKEVDETGHGFAGRLVIAPQINNDLLIHTGIASIYQTPYDNSEKAEFKSEPETKIGDVEFLDTDEIKDVDHTFRVGLEGALQFKNISLQGEYVTADVIRLDDSDKEDATFSGGYGFISWILTGEKRKWSVKDGEFGQIIPKNSYGAWELAARYSHLDLTEEDANIFGGMANNITFGVNWYTNPNIKFQLNYTMVDQSQSAIHTNEKDITVGEDGYDFNYLHFMTVLYF